MSIVKIAAKDDSYSKPFTVIGGGIGAGYGHLKGEEVDREAEKLLNNIKKEKIVRLHDYFEPKERLAERELSIQKGRGKLKNSILLAGLIGGAALGNLSGSTIDLIKRN
jgi:hypothetical protein